MGEELGKNIEIIKKVFPKGLPNDITPGDLFDLARKISLERLGVTGVTEGVMFLRRPLSEDGSNRLPPTGSSPALHRSSLKLDREIFKPKGLRLQIGIPFSPLQKDVPLITTDMLRAVGLDKLDRLVKDWWQSPRIKQHVNAGKIIRGAFDRFYDVDPRYVEEIIKPFENERSLIAAQVIQDADELLRTFRPGQGCRGRVCRVMNAFDAGIEVPAPRRK